jgi:hypothetical protein
VVVVDEDVDVLPRLAALVAQADVHLRVLPREFRQQAAHVVGHQTKVRLSQSRRTAAQRPQRGRD